jgi:hypothetical protein
MSLAYAAPMTRIKPGPKPSITGDVVKTTFKIRRPLWLRAHKLALDRGTDLATLVNEALEQYLKGTR